MIPHSIQKDEQGTLISISIFLDYKPYSVESTHVNFEEIRQFLLRGDNDEDELLKLIDVKATVQSYVADNVSIQGNEIFFKGRRIHNKVVDLIFEYIADGHPFEHLARFLSNLLENPSKRSVDLAWEYLTRYNMPITERGTFLAMKAVTSDFKDKHTGKLDNSVGSVVSEPRNEISDDPDYPCHRGLHCGYVNYVEEFGYSNDQIVLVEVDPKNIVCVPKDCKMQKMRVCEYTVVKSLGTHTEFFSKERGDFRSNNAKTIQPEYQEDPKECDECCDDIDCDHCGRCYDCCECDD